MMSRVFALIEDLYLSFNFFYYLAKIKKLGNQFTMMGVPFEQIFFIRIVHFVMLLVDGIVRCNGCDIFKGVNPNSIDL